MRLLKAAVAGYRDGKPSERGLLGIAASFAVTVGASRSINYVRERRRPLPTWRSFGRRLYHLPGAARDRRVHHFIPGIGLGFATGVAAILTRDDGLESWLSLPFGTGLALTTDELGLLLEGSNPYWGSETFALAQCAAASLASAALAARFSRRGLKASAPPEQMTTRAPATVAVSRARLLGVPPSLGAGTDRRNIGREEQ
jgi:hypothetical protein